MKTNKKIKKYTKIQKFLYDHAEEIEKTATEKHKEILGTATLRTELLSKYIANHVIIVKEVANNLNDTNRGTKIFKKMGTQVAKDSVRDGLTLQEAVNGAIFLTQAIWEKIKESNLLEELSIDDFYQLVLTIESYSDIISSKIAFTYHDYFFQQVKKTEQRKDEFIGMASHELKSPVTSVKAYLQLIQRKLLSQKKNGIMLQIEKMNHQINKLTVLIDDLLNLSKIQAGKIKFHKHIYPIDEVITETVESIQATTKHKIIIEGITSKMVYIDKDRIEQVLVNLITNAIKYSPQADRIIVSYISDEKYVTISVQDFGIGIAKEHQKKVFDRFFRVEGENEKKYTGFGIGLYICLEILKNHAGDISVTSTKGKGSTFSFRLPIYAN